MLKDQETEKKDHQNDGKNK